MRIGKLLNIIKNVGLLGVGVGAHHYGGQLLENIENYGKMTSGERLETKIDSANEALAYLVARDKALALARQRQEEALGSASTELENQVGTFHKAVENVNKNGPNSKNMGELNDKAHDVMDTVNKIIDIFKSSGSGSSNSNSFVGNYLDINIVSFRDFLDSLTLLEESAVLHILMFSLIIIVLFSIIGIFMGNELINYFELEKKLPSLSRFLKLRAKFQRYYLFWDIFTIFIICLIGLTLNVLVFLISK